MPTQSLSIETTDQKQPLFLIYGDSPLLPVILDAFSSRVSFIVIGNQQIPVSAASVHRISISSLYLVDKLVEHIDYAILFMNSEEDKKNISLLYDKFASDQTKVDVIIPVRITLSFIDMLTELKRLSHLVILLLGDLYGTRTISPVSTFLQEVIESKKSIVHENDIEPLYPIYEQDALYILSLSLFGVRQRHKIIPLFYTDPQTRITALHLIHRVEPDLLITYEQSPLQSSQKPFSEIRGILEQQMELKVFYVTTGIRGFEKSIEQFLEHKATLLLSSPKDPSRSLKLMKKISVKKGGVPIVLALIFSCILFLLIETAALITARIYLHRAAQNLETFHIQQAVQNVKSAELPLLFVKPSLLLIGSFAPESALSTSLNIVFSGTSFLTDPIFTHLNYQTLSQGISAPDLNSAIAATISTYFLLEKTYAENMSQSCMFCILSPSTLQKIVNPAISQLISVSALLPQLIGYTHDKEYLVLFQNNGELRPTGGFIGSVGDLRLSQGKVDDFTIQDVYDLDGQLKLHIPPHYICLLST